MKDNEHTQRFAVNRLYLLNLRSIITFTALWHKSSGALEILTKSNISIEKRLTSCGHTQQRLGIGDGNAACAVSLKEQATCYLCSEFSRIQKKKGNKKIKCMLCAACHPARIKKKKKKKTKVIKGVIGFWQVTASYKLWLRSHKGEHFKNENPVIHGSHATIANEEKVAQTRWHQI